METKVNLVLLGALAVTWGAMSLAEPAAALDPSNRNTDDLAELEDAVAANRGDTHLASALADRYLSLRQPQLAVATLSASTPEVREDPAILHRLAQAYEETGRMDDALATARLALARCGRALGTSDASTVTPLPAEACSERTYAALDMHAAALSHLAQWGVTDVQNDPRARRAYVLAVRTATIVSASAE
jgi:tetratricopeptide (TPR) repeat protein